MKSKLLALSGIIIAVVSTAVLAGKSATSWQQDLQAVQLAQKNVPDDVSALLPSMQGIQAEETAYLDDDKALYVSRPNDLNEKANRRKIAEGVDHVFDQKGGKVLFARNLVVQDEVGGIADLWLANTQTGGELKLSDGAGGAVISSTGKYIAVSDLSSGGINLFTGNGVFLKKVGTYGALPLFSPDEKKLAYYKFASVSFDRDIKDNALGLAIYDIATESEVLVTDHAQDSQPVAFSPNGNKLYFNSARTSTYSLWVVDILSREIKQISNKKSVSGFSGTLDPLMEKAVLSSDGLMMVSVSYDDNVAVLMFDKNSEIVSSRMFGKGSNPRWLIEGSVIAYRTQGAKGKYWEFVSVK